MFMSWEIYISSIIDLVTLLATCVIRLQMSGKDSDSSTCLSTLYACVNVESEFYISPKCHTSFKDLLREVVSVAYFQRERKPH